MLKLENITKYYYSSSSVTCALRKINLEFNIGEFVAITGESGSGKTTLLNILSGLDSYEDGEMYFYDQKTSYFDNSDWEKYRKEEISFIFQNYNLIDSFNVLENVIVSYLINGYSYKVAKHKSKEILKFVGLEKDLKKKASKLSGGQKQRLAIARALAKETKIIVADEPTGNLDNENGNAILKLLKEISKEKLVIVVTHNIGQIEPFINRKVRLHDGEVVLDEKYYNLIENQLINKEMKPEKDYRKIFNFAFLNIKAQPNKSFLMFILVFICTLSSFVFFTNFKMNLDDHKTKNVDNSLFLNLDDTRMLVMKNDSSVISDEILNEANVKHVKNIEKYDYITDVNYYRPSDYKTVFAGGYGPSNPPGGPDIFYDRTTTKLINHNRYMRSSYCLSQDMLKEGRLPTGNLEMVVYSDDNSILDTTEIVYFRNDRKQAEDTHYTFEVKIVGLLKKADEQAYFSEDLCQMMDFTQQNLGITLEYYIEVEGEISTRYLNLNSIAIDYSLESNKLSLSEENAKSISFIKKGTTPKTTLRLYKNVKYIYNDVSHQSPYSSKLNNLTLGVSKELFDEVYKNYKNKTQFAIFIDDYAYTDEVTYELAKLNFESISCYNVSTTSYNVEKVVFRYVNLSVSIVSLLLINIVIILLCLAIMKIKKNDYIILKMIGLENNICKKINYVEVIFYGIISNIALLFTSLIVKNTVNNLLIQELYKYVKYYDYLIILVIILLSMLYLGKLFAKFLTKKIKISMLREED